MVANKSVSVLEQRIGIAALPNGFVEEATRAPEIPANDERGWYNFWLQQARGRIHRIAEERPTAAVQTTFGRLFPSFGFGRRESMVGMIRDDSTQSPDIPRRFIDLNDMPSIQYAYRGHLYHDDIIQVMARVHRALESFQRAESSPQPINPCGEIPLYPDTPRLDKSISEAIQYFKPRPDDPIHIVRPQKPFIHDAFVRIMLEGTPRHRPFHAPRRTSDVKAFSSLVAAPHIRFFDHYRRRRSVQ